MFNLSKKYIVKRVCLVFKNDINKTFIRLLFYYKKVKVAGLKFLGLGLHSNVFEFTCRERLT